MTAFGRPRCSFIVAGRPDIAELRRYSSCLSIALSPGIITLPHGWSTRRHAVRILRERSCASCSVASGCRDELGLLREPSHQRPIRVVNSHHWRRCNAQTERKNCSTEFPAEESPEMHGDEARTRRCKFLLADALPLRLGIITLSLRSGVVPARTHRMQQM